MESKGDILIEHIQSRTLLKFCSVSETELGLLLLMWRRFFEFIWILFGGLNSYKWSMLVASAWVVATEKLNIFIYFGLSPLRRSRHRNGVFRYPSSRGQWCKLANLEQATANEDTPEQKSSLHSFGFSQKRNKSRDNGADLRALITIWSLP